MGHSSKDSITTVRFFATYFPVKCRAMRIYCLAFVLIATAAFAQQEGDLVSKDALVHALPADKDHPAPREVIDTHEEELTAQSSSKSILVVHYRAGKASWESQADDRLVLALKQGDQFKILKVFESDTVVMDGKLISENDFDEEAIVMDARHFIDIRTSFSGSGAGVTDDVYAISSKDVLSTMAFEDVSKSKLLKPGDELRNGGYFFQDGTFIFEAGIYLDKDGECCPSQGTYHAKFKLAGSFKEDSGKQEFDPDFKFVIDKEWRDEK